MEKTIENLRKFLHISSTKKGIKEITDNFPIKPENSVENYQTVPFSEEIGREDIIGR